MAVSLTIFPKPLTWKYVLGGAMVTAALYFLQKLGRQQKDSSLLSGGGGGAAGERGGHGGERGAV